jgi:hypothetical protein
MQRFVAFADALRSTAEDPIRLSRGARACDHKSQAILFGAPHNERIRDTLLYVLIGIGI